MASSPELVGSIQFHRLMDQLTDEEFETFLRRIGRETIANRISTSFLPSTTTKSTPDPSSSVSLESMTKIVSKMIVDRRTDDIESQTSALSTNSKKRDIHSLPSDLIREIASYLDTKSYYPFMCSDRSLFVWSNTPNQLHFLDLEDLSFRQTLFSPLSQLDPFNFNQLRRLKLCMEHLSGESGPIHNGFNRLEKLTIIMESRTHGMHPSFLNDESDCFPNLQSLTLENRGTKFIAEHRFDKLLRKCHNIHCLVLDNVTVWPVPPYDSINFENLCPKLDALYFRNSCEFVKGFVTQLLRSWGSQLTYLELDQCDAYTLELCEYNWPRLEQVSIDGVSAEAVGKLLESQKGLYSVMYTPKWTDQDSANDRDIEEVRIIMERCMAELPLLDWLNIHNSTPYLEAICKGVARGMSHRKKRELIELEDQELKILLDLTSRDVDAIQKSSVHSFIETISKIVESLGNSKVFDCWEFAVIFAVCQEDMMLSFKDELSSWVDSLPFVAHLQTIYNPHSITRPTTQFAFSVANYKSKYLDSL